MVTREDEAFDSLVYSFIRELLELNPLIGSYLGLHEYDVKLPDVSKDRILYAIERLEWYRKKFMEIDPSRLTGSRRIDYRPLLGEIEASLIQMRDWPTWRMMPTGFSIVGEALFLVFSKDHLPIEHRMLSLYNRLKGVEKVLRDSIDCVDEPYQLWIDLAKMISGGLPSLLNAIKSFSLQHGYKDVADLCDHGLEVLKKYMEKLEDLRSRSKPGFKPIGRELFVKLLRARMVEEDIDELRKHGYREAEKYRRLMEEAAREMGAKNIEEAFAKLKQYHVSSPEEVIETYRKTVEKVRSFVVEKDIVELPPMEQVEVIETPEFLRPLYPFAGYSAPEIFGWSYKGRFFVTKPVSKEMLEHHNIYDILNTVVHEAYPGHHVQAIYVKNASSPIRKMIMPVDLVEGWAHYCEELMLEKGIDTSPQYRFKVYHDALWRAVRVYVDIELSTGMITFEEAVEKLAKDAYLPKEGAYHEVLRYTLNPGYQLCYNYGKTRIKMLRERVKQILGDRYRDSLFHRMLLEEGMLPLRILEEVVLEKARRLASLTT